MWVPLFYWHAKTTEISVTPFGKLYINCSVGRLDNSLHHWLLEEQQGAKGIHKEQEGFAPYMGALWNTSANTVEKSSRKDSGKIDMKR